MIYVISHDRIRIHTSARSAFTLVELLVVIVLMSILSGMMTYALSSANEDARIKRSRAETKMMAQVLAGRVNDIQLQAVELLEATASGTTTITGFNNAPDRNRALMLARRELAGMTASVPRGNLASFGHGCGAIRQGARASAMECDASLGWHANFNRD